MNNNNNQRVFAACLESVLVVNELISFSVIFINIHTQPSFQIKITFDNLQFCFIRNFQYSIINLLPLQLFSFYHSTCSDLIS